MVKGRKMMTTAGLLRDPEAEKSDRVGFIELFFDLVFVFAVTQLAHRLVEYPSPVGVAQSLVLFLAIWSVWTGTTWVTNRLDVERNSVRLLLLAMMIGGLFQALAIPDAFELSRDARAFAVVHIVLQLGRTLFILGAFVRRNTLHLRHSLRTVMWVLTAAPFWIVGALQSEEERLFWWAAALVIEYGATAARYWVPGIGTSQAADWDVEANHFAERCGLFIIIALGELILITGNTVGDLTLNLYTLTAFLSILVTSMAMWWIYFSYSAEKNAHAVEDAWDSGRAARIVYVYLHIPLICGLLLSAAGDEALVNHPADAAALSDLIQIVGGTALFLVGALVVKRVICGRFMSSHLTGILMLILLPPLVQGMPLYLVGVSVAAVMVTVAFWEEVAIRLDRRRKGLDEDAGAEEKISMVEV
jgi:low temperature requirement protein LtrA